MKYFLIYFLFASLLFSEELAIENLLKEYGNSQELYKKTKSESAGHLILFSRADLDKMQAYTLNDVLKTIRMYNIQVNSAGITTLVKSSASLLSNNPVKIFINEHELNSATLGNALTQYGKMNIYFIDHIEVYQSGDSVAFGNEPGSMIVKIYTKEPYRENGTSTQISVDSKGSLRLQVLDARKIDDYSYMTNIDISKDNYDTIKVNDYDMSRDGFRGQLYFKFSKDEDYDLELSVLNSNNDSFKGMGNAPVDGYLKNENFYIHATKYFKNDFKVKLSVSHEKLEAYNADEEGMLLYGDTLAYSFDFLINTDIQDIILEKKFVYENNDLLIGTHFKNQEFSVNKFNINNEVKPMDWGPDSLKIYMAYLENLYNINKNNLIVLSAKLDYYENSFSKSSVEHILRLGYISILNDVFTFKLFGLKSYSYPTFRQTTFSPTININPDLDSANIITYTAEGIYSKDKISTSVGIGYGETTDTIIFDKEHNIYINSLSKGYFHRGYVRAEYKFDINNKIMVEFFKMYKNNYSSPGSGALVQVFNKIGKFDIYNELVYRDDYTVEGNSIYAGYNYTLGVIYPFSRDLDIKLKGDNLLDKASTIPINGYNVSAIERRILLTLEYVF